MRDSCRREQQSNARCPDWATVSVALWVFLFWAASPLAADSLTPLNITGPNDKRINIVVVSEGYTAADLANFFADADGFIDDFFSEEPFATYANYFNVYLLEVASAQSGADVPGDGIFVDTAFNATFGNPPLERLLTVSTSLVSGALAANAPFYDIGLVLVNSGIYGGSGGFYPVSSNHPSAPQIAAHELGHSFGGLADEYESPGGTPQEAPNATAETSAPLVKWNQWFEAGTAIPTPETSAYSNIVGLFEGAVYTSAGWYRPHLDSKMRTLDRPWGQVNSERLIRKIYQSIPPFHGQSPASPDLFVDLPQPLDFGVLELMDPVGHSLEITWRVDGVEQETASGSTLSLLSSGLGNGLHVVEVEVNDSTSMVRDRSGDLLKETASWTVSVTNHLTFTDWIQGVFPGQPSLQGPQVDADGDTLINLGEFVLGGDPAVRDAAGVLPQSSFEGGRLRVEFTRDLNRLGVAIVVEAGNNLESWNEIARSEHGLPFSGVASLIETPAGAGKAHVRVEDTVTIQAAATGRYLRVRFLSLQEP